MATTTNYSWTTPDDTSLVKDGAAAIRSLGSAIDSTVFTNAGNAINKTIVDAKGDIIAATAADTVARLAVGTNNQVLTVDSTTATGLKWAALPSAGGWTVRSKALDLYNSASFITYGIAYLNSTWWIYGSGGKLARSTDGITWTTVTSGFGTTAIRGITWSGSLYVVVGSAGVLTTSSDGTTFTARTSGFGTTTIRDVSFGNGIFVAVGDTGKISYSTDGTTWTNTTAGTTRFNRVVYLSSGTIFTTVGDNSVIYSSTNGSSWTLRTAAVAGANHNQVFVVNGVIYGTAATSDINTCWYRSTNGTTFSTVYGNNYPDGAADNEVRSLANFGGGVALGVLTNLLPGAGEVLAAKPIAKFVPSNFNGDFVTTPEVLFPTSGSTKYSIASDGAGKIVVVDNYYSILTNF